MMNNLVKNNTLVRWDITKKCNLSCKHCINGNRYNKTEELSLSQKKTGY